MRARVPRIALLAVLAALLVAAPASAQDDPFSVPEGTTPELSQQPPEDLEEAEQERRGEQRRGDDDVDEDDRVARAGEAGDREDELPATGLGAVAVALIGAGMLMSGAGLRLVVG